MKNANSAGTPASQVQQPAPSPVRGANTGETLPPANATQPAQGEGSTPPAGAPPAAPPATAPGAGAPPAAPPATAPGAGGAPRKGAPMITMSEADLRERLRRTSSSQLRKLFGTDDEAQIKQRIQQMNEIERQQEEERQARLTAEQRLTEQLENERKARIAAEQRMQRIADQRAVESQGAMITRLASQHINPEYTDEASLAFARHIQQQRPQAVARMTEKDIGKWFADYAAKKPALARQGATPPPGPRVETRPAGSPRPPPRPPQGQRPQNPTQKTMRPGQPNSMTREEVRAELRKRGINYG